MAYNGGKNPNWLPFNIIANSNSLAYMCLLEGIVLTVSSQGDPMPFYSEGIELIYFDYPQTFKYIYLKIFQQNT